MVPVLVSERIIFFVTLEKSREMCFAMFVRTTRLHSLTTCYCRLFHSPLKHFKSNNNQNIQIYVLFPRNKQTNKTRTKYIYLVFTKSVDSTILRTERKMARRFAKVPEEKLKQHFFIHLIW